VCPDKNLCNTEERRKQRALGNPGGKDFDTSAPLPVERWALTIRAKLLCFLLSSVFRKVSVSCTRLTLNGIANSLSRCAGSGFGK
jgi:hypothetical protein